MGEEFEEVVELRPLTKDMVQGLVNAFGSVAMPIIAEMGNIDYEAGQGVLKTTDSNDRCMWLKSGHRISVYLGASRIVTLSDQPDHTYMEILAKSAGFLQDEGDNR